VRGGGPDDDFTIQNAGPALPIGSAGIGSSNEVLHAQQAGTYAQLIFRFRRTSIFVRFDGNKTATTLHRDYVEPIEA